MIITICGSMAFAEQMMEAKKILEAKQHKIYVSGFTEAYIGKSVKEKESLTVHHKNEKDAIKEHWEKIKKSDAILVLNYYRKGIKNYIGGNTLMEIGFAHVLDKKIFLLNNIPEISYYKSEIEACKPIMLDGNLGKV